MPTFGSNGLHFKASYSSSVQNLQHPLADKKYAIVCRSEVVTEPDCNVRVETCLKHFVGIKAVAGTAHELLISRPRLKNSTDPARRVKQTRWDELRTGERFGCLGFPEYNPIPARLFIVAYAV
jgi:hypothetical protein